MWEREGHQTAGHEESRITPLGKGSPGGKAAGLIRMEEFMRQNPASLGSSRISLAVPDMLVLKTGVFDAFMELNGLYAFLETAPSDRVIAETFQKASLPPQYIGEIYSYIDKKRTPLAIRSSSLFEDAKAKPFAGVYMTKMIPNNQWDTAVRFQKAAEALKLVYASTFFEAARIYAAANNLDIGEEKMAVIIQEMAGRRRGRYYFPELSGVLRSVNYYPSGSAEPEDGIAELAAGLGKTIVDGGSAWALSPRYPLAPPPFNSPRDMLKQSQTRLWAVDLEPPATWDPIRETEYMTQLSLEEAEAAGALRELASSYDLSSDRFYPGLSGRGPRLLNFAPLLSDGDLGLPDFMAELLSAAADFYGDAVEIEFALTLSGGTGEPARFDFLQIRPMTIFDRDFTIDTDLLAKPDPLLFSEQALGNGCIDNIRDIVYIKREAFDPARTREMVPELEGLNAELLKARRPYLLIGFGRWGTSEPWMGIPVTWPQIAGAGAIVECAMPVSSPDLSQGSHFFHNLSSRGIPYLCLSAGKGDVMNWEELEACPPRFEGEFVRHTVTDRKLAVIVDGKNRKGGVFL